MKKISLPLVLTFLIFFISCSQQNDSKISFDTKSTLKSHVNETEEEILWTEELEGERLTRNLKLPATTISKDILPEPATISILENYQNPVFSELDDFGSLDTTLLSDAQKVYIANFIEKMTGDYDSASTDFFQTSYLFTYEFFKTSLSEDFKQKFDLKFDSDYIKQNYSEFIIAGPFIQETNLLVPVRIILKNYYFDFTLELSNNAANPKIYNIELLKSGENK